MNNAFCIRTLFAISMDMCHHIMAHNFFFFLSHIIVDIILIFFQFVNLLLCDTQTQFLFTFRKRDPKFSPRAEFIIR
ncbi:hypothetical protein SDC9_117542 [bioreactor metagenome]|uniref:Uncharacterized protein n=1 Tax=bioreactor metagenome TaxID=1076179 RepID=A0A645BZT3_9ZZZZ